MSVFDIWGRVEKPTNGQKIISKENGFNLVEQNKKEIKYKVKESAKEKFKAIKDYADKNGWLLIDKVEEDDEDNYPSLTYLTQNGKVVDITREDETIHIDNQDDYEIEFNEEGED